jgi:hypothetical protein
MRPISRHELDGHLQKLRRILRRHFELRRGEANHDAVFSLVENIVPSSEGPIASYVLNKGASTENALNDRGENDVCAVFFERADKRILCSFFEKWNVINPKKPQYRFDKAGITFFLAFESGPQTLRKQIFRLDWDNWERDDTSGAAHPHWNFDQWLTASEQRDHAATELRERFDPVPTEPQHFEAAARPVSDRPSLAWFTRLHFPMIATCDPKRPQPHRSIPDSLEQLEGWLDSILSYLKNEIDEYMYGGR